METAESQLARRCGRDLHREEAIPRGGDHHLRWSTSNDPLLLVFRGDGTQTIEVPRRRFRHHVGENDKELLIVTNNHVGCDSTELKVTFIDDEVVEAVVMGTDSDSDLAIIAVPLDNIPAGDAERKVRGGEA